MNNIQKVVINNFRNYIGLHEFDITKKITIFFGPNGFGKSSFFDAVEWCLTGGIGRFNEFHPKDVLSQHAHHDDMECYVEIIFSGNKLTRKFRSGGNVLVEIKLPNGLPIRGKDKVDEFLRHEYFTDNNETSYFGGLVKQSHILSQDQITEFILHDDPKKRFDSLADILGLKNVLYLLDNAKGVLGKINSIKMRLNEEFESFTPMIEMRKKDLIQVDIGRLTTLASSLKLIKEEENVLNLVPHLQEKLTDLINEVSSRITLYNSFVNLGYQTLQKSKNQCENFSEDRKVIEREIEALNKLVSRIENLKFNILDKKELFEKITSIDEDIQKSRKNLIVNDFEKFDSSTSKAVENLVREKRNRLKRVEYALSYISEYKNLTKEIDNHPKQIQILNERKGFLRRRSARISNVLGQVETLIMNADDSAITRLLESVRGVYNVIKEDGSNGQCPVCSAEQGDQLFQNIERNIDSYTENMLESANYVSKLLSLKSRFEQNQKQTKRDLDKIKSEENKLDIQLKNSKERHDFIKGAELFETELFGDFMISQLTQQNDTIAKDINRYESVLNSYRSIIALEGDRKSLLETLGTTKVASSELLLIRMERLARASVRIQGLINRKQGVRKDVINQFESLYKQIALIPQDLSSRDMNNSINLLTSTLFQQQSTLKSDLDFVVGLRQTIEHSEKVQQDVLSLEKKQDDIQQKLVQFQAKIDSIENFTRSIGLKLGSAAMDFLNISSSTIQKYYRYLNPLPTVSPVRFEGESGELKIMVQLDENEDGKLSNAQHTLSSGQLNVLAIAIFLAINDAQKVSKLDFVAIDDPIQNMDDVNQFSICDILGKLDRQLIFSTHDLDFLKLFIKKNEQQKEEIQVFFLESPRLYAGKVRQLTF